MMRVKIRITLNPEYTDYIHGENKSSLEFNGPYNVVDLQSTAGEYLARSGKTVFGQTFDGG